MTDHAAAVDRSRLSQKREICDMLTEEGKVMSDERCAFAFKYNMLVKFIHKLNNSCIEVIYIIYQTVLLQLYYNYQ